jgi:glycosyltransferase involved in cell wall biosynthesis
MPRVLHVLNTLQRSGAEVMLAAAIPYFRAAGYDTHILSTGREVGGFAPILEQLGCVVHHIPFAKNPAFFQAFRALTIQERPDIVHVHCERAAVFYTALVASRARVVRTVHGWFDFTGALRARKILERWVCRQVFDTRHIAPSPSVAENERRRFLNGTLLCPNWYDDVRFFPPDQARRDAARQALGYDDDDVVVVSVGSHAPVKNLTEALHALASLRDNRRLRFLHLGRPVDPDIGDSLPLRAEALGLSAITRFVGDTDDVPFHLHAADVHLMPSLREGMGVAAVEAMATGLPQILSDVPGLADFKNLAPGIHHVEPTADGLSGAIAVVAAMTGADRRHLGLGIAKATQGMFSTPVGAARYIALYKAISPTDRW